MPNLNNKSILYSSDVQKQKNFSVNNKINENMNTSLLLVNPAIESHAKFLYDLLNERSSKSNISNRKVTSWKDHLNFIDYNNPYSDWYIIQNNKQWTGSIYLTHRNEIGIYISMKFRKQGIGKDALKLLIEKHPRRFYYSNVNPNNEDLKKFYEKYFGKTNYKLVEMCYEIVQESNS